MILKEAQKYIKKKFNYKNGIYVDVYFSRRHRIKISKKQTPTIANEVNEERKRNIFIKLIFHSKSKPPSLTNRRRRINMI